MEYPDLATDGNNIPSLASWAEEIVCVTIRTHKAADDTGVRVSGSPGRLCLRALGRNNRAARGPPAKGRDTRGAAGQDKGSRSVDGGSGGRGGGGGGWGSRSGRSGTCISGKRVSVRVRDGQTNNIPATSSPRVLRAVMSASRVKALGAAEPEPVVEAVEELAVAWEEASSV